MLNKELQQLRIFDTTLRDGDQTAGFAFSSLNQKEKLAVAIDEYGVDCIEAGFPCASEMEFKTCSQIASKGLQAEIAVMTRCRENDIRKSVTVFKGMKKSKSMLHISLPISQMHMKDKLCLSPSKVQKLMVTCIRQATDNVHAVEMGFEDASRADPEFLCECCSLAIQNGARIINIADTTGSLLPNQTAKLVRFLKNSVPEFLSGTGILSIHCHNDMGLALSSALTAVESGAGQIEVSVGGIGERCGNVPLEQLAYALDEYQDYFKVHTNLRPEKTHHLCHTLFSFLGTDLSPFRPVTGWNTDSHASGIHQQGICANEKTYIVHNIKKYNMVQRRFILSRHSGTSGLRTILENLITSNSALKKATTPSMLDTLLVAVKDAGAHCSAIGITELCKILYNKNIIKQAPYTCSKISVHKNLRNQKQSVVVHAEVIHATKKILFFEQSGNSFEDCCTNIACNICNKTLS